MDMRSTELVVPVVMRERLDAAARRRLTMSLRGRRERRFDRIRQLQLRVLIPALTIPNVT
jgi:hypothetical protein